LREINEALEENQRIQSEKRKLLNDQTCQARDYVVASLKKLHRVRKHKAIVGSERKIEMEKLEEQLLNEIKRSVDLLEDVLVSVITLDVVRGDVTIDRLLKNLEDSNARLRDVAGFHDEWRQIG
jgi:hypothetical protein